MRLSRNRQLRSKLQAACLLRWNKACASFRCCFYARWAQNATWLINSVICGSRSNIMTAAHAELGLDVSPLGYCGPLMLHLMIWSRLFHLKAQGAYCIWRITWLWSQTSSPQKHIFQWHLTSCRGFTTSLPTKSFSSHPSWAVQEGFSQPLAHAPI